MSTATYHRAIATLSNKLLAFNLPSKIDLATMVQSDMLWDLIVKKLPEVQSLATEVEEELSCELSYNQCCNAVGWLHKYNPGEWNKFLTDTQLVEDVDVFAVQ